MDLFDVSFDDAPDVPSDFSGVIRAVPAPGSFVNLGALTRTGRQYFDVQLRAVDGPSPDCKVSWRLWQDIPQRFYPQLYPLLGVQLVDSDDDQDAFDAFVARAYEAAGLTVNQAAHQVGIRPDEMVKIIQALAGEVSVQVTANPYAPGELMVTKAFRAQSVDC